MNNTKYLFFAVDDDLRVIKREVNICPIKLIVDNFLRGGNPCFIPVGVLKILYLVSGM